MTENIEKILAYNVSSLREARGWTQEILATYSNLALGSIAQIETCKRWPKPATLRQIAEALEIPVWRLFRSPNDVLEIDKPSDEMVLNIVLDRFGYKPVPLKRAGKWPKKKSPEQEQ